jgi:hypothetical protein
MEYNQLDYLLKFRDFLHYLVLKKFYVKIFLMNVVIEEFEMNMNLKKITKKCS